MAKQKSSAENQHPSTFSEQLASLEQLVHRIEVGELTLEESVQAYQAGVTLLKQCQVTLAQAEQTVQMLSSDNTLMPYADKSGVDGHALEKDIFN